MPPSPGEDVAKERQGTLGSIFLRKSLGKWTFLGIPASGDRISPKPGFQGTPRKGLQEAPVPTWPAVAGPSRGPQPQRPVLGDPSPATRILRLHISSGALEPSRETRDPWGTPGGRPGNPWGLGGTRGHPWERPRDPQGEPRGDSRDPWGTPGGGQGTLIARR